MTDRAGFTIQSIEDGSVGPGLLSHRGAAFEQGKAQLILLTIGDQRADLGFSDMSNWNLPDPAIELHGQV